MAWWRIGLVAWVLAVGCTRPNPQSCSDGTCTDPGFPFCDVDGALRGIPESCIAVQCSPGEVVSCRGDQAIQCNASGHDFDLVQCAFGCDPSAGGCLGCASNEQCDNPLPVCDMGPGTCRGCQLDDECASTVCDVTTGTCLAEASIVYASPTGFSTGPACTLDQPCALGSAVMIAVGAGIPLTLRLLPGVYSSVLSTTTLTSSPLRVVATGANLAVGFEVRNGASMDIRGATVISAGGNGIDGRLICSGGTTATATLSMRDSRIAVTHNSAMVVAVRCALRITNSELAIDGSSVSIGIDIGPDSTFDGDRLRIHPSNGSQLTALSTTSKNVKVHLTNSILENAGLGMNTSDTALPGSELLFAYNTFVFSNHEQVDCQFPRANRTTRFENNILFSGTTTEPVLGTNCTFVNNLLSPGTAMPNNTIADPKFVDLAARNFRLQATSPAVNAGVASAVALDPDHDFEGAARPQGPNPDLGAFELTP